MSSIKVIDGDNTGGGTRMNLIPYLFDKDTIIFRNLLSSQHLNKIKFLVKNNNRHLLFS